MTNQLVAVLQPTVVQYYDDDISNVGGLTSVLAAQVRTWALPGSLPSPVFVRFGMWAAG
jgi:hypothetical protein